MSSSLQHHTNATLALTNIEGKARIDGWLNYRLRITIADSRAFEGRFKCVDRDCNIVLAGTEEFKDSTLPLFYPPPFTPWVGFRPSILMWW
jgi:hypothetical protein